MLSPPRHQDATQCNSRALCGLVSLWFVRTRLYAVSFAYAIFNKRHMMTHPTSLGSILSYFIEGVHSPGNAL